MIKTYKFRIYPTKKQRVNLEFQFEQSRYVYNNLLADRINAYKKDKSSISRYDTQVILKNWKDNHEIQLKEMHSQVLQHICYRLDIAYKNFFRRVKQQGIKAGFPRYKTENFCSLIYPQTGFKFTKGKMKVSKIGELKMKVHRWFPETIKQMTIKKSKTGKYHMCLTCKVEAKPLPKTKKSIAFDLGIKNFIHTSENKAIGNPKYMNKKLKQLKSYSRQFSKTKSYKHRKRLNYLFEKVTNQREDLYHKLSKNFITNYDNIIIEDLNIKSMLEGKNTNKNLNRNINDVAWNSFSQKLIYKAESAGRKVVKVNPANTSNTCSQCKVKHNLTLSDRNMPCCGIDRDYNASLNILRLGMQSLGIKSLEAPSFR